MRLFCTGWAVAAVLGLACAGSAAATVITPTVTTDDLAGNGNCTLREAVQAADTNAKVDQCPAGRGTDVIMLGAHTYDLTLSGTPEDHNASGDLDITSPVTVAGAGAASTTIDAHGIDRALDVLAGAVTTMQNLTVTGGHALNGGLGAPGASGGAIRAISSLTLTNVSVNSSTAGDASTAGTVLPGGPGPAGNGGGDGGGVWSDTQLTVTGGSFTGDHAGNGSAGGGGGGRASSSPGQPGGPGGAGGPGGSGGAIAVAGSSQLTVVGTTFSNDSAGSGGTGGSGGDGGQGNPGNGGGGGAGGDGGAGGAGGAISASGGAAITGISTGSTSAGTGGVAGVGARGGAGGGGGSQGLDGNNGSSGHGGYGGVINAGAATLTIAGATLTNGAAGPGGAGPVVTSGQSASQTRTGGPGTGGNGGAVSSAGTVTIDHTTMSFDHAGAGGAGGETLIRAYAGGPGGAGGAVDGVAVNLSGSTVSGSAAGAGGTGGTGFTNAAGGTGGGGGAVHAHGTLSLRGVTLDHDSAGTGGNGAAASSTHAAAPGGGGGPGGAVLADGGGTIDDVTLFADKAGNGGAAGNGLSVAPGAAGGAGGDGGSVRGPSASLILLHMTVVGGAPGAGGAGLGGPGPAGTTGGVSSAGTVAASVLSGSSGPQCSGTLNGGANVNFPDSSCGGLTTDPKLGTLDSNGGPTQTLLPAIDSPVLDLIPTGGVTCSNSDPDQRGAPRPQGTRCDSGAVEAANPALSATPASASFTSLPAGQSTTKTITIRASFDPVSPAATLTGPDVRAFAMSGDRCSARTLAPLGTCTLLVTFKSSGPRGLRHAALHLTHNRIGPPLDVPLSGTVGAVPPMITKLSLTNSTFAVARAVTSRTRHKHTPPKGTTIAFRLSEPASVLFAVQQRLPGRVRHKRCVPPTAQLAKAKRCTRTITRGSFTRRRPTGLNHVLFSGRLRHGALAPGRYTLVLRATAFGRVRGRSRSIDFTIVRG